MTDVKIWESIQYMDHEGMDILRKGSKKGTARVFKEYLDRTEVSVLQFPRCSSVGSQALLWGKSQD